MEITIKPVLHVFADLEEASRALAEELRRVSSGNVFRLAVSGGRTAARLYEILAGEYRDRIRWDRVHVFWADERFVAPDHPASNVRMVEEALLRRVSIPRENVHAPRTDRGGLEAAARDYEHLLRSELGDGGATGLDAVLLGLGEDGHIASLFPGSPALRERERWVAPVRDAPKPPPERLTLALPLLSRSGAAHFLVAGEEKAAALAATLEGDLDPERFPAQGVGAPQTWWVDRAAAGQLRRGRAT